MIIRPERPGDEDTIHELTRLAFETMPYSDGSEPDIIRRLRADGDLTFSFVAEVEAQIVGHVAFSPVRINELKVPWYGLGPISVSLNFQRQGIARRMVEYGIGALGALGASGCVLIGDPKLYSKLGFKSNQKLNYGDVPPEIVQFRSLDGTAPVGTLKFAKAFDLDDAK